MLKSSDYRLFCHLFQLLFTLLHIHVCEKKKYSKTLFVLKNTLILQSLLINNVKIWPFVLQAQLFIIIMKI